MTNNTISIEPILKSIECYSTTSLQLFKLYVVDFIGTLFAELYTKLIVLVLLVSCFIFLSIGIALWLGTIIGAAYLGFLALAAIFLILTIPITVMILMDLLFIITITLKKILKKYLLIPLLFTIPMQRERKEV